MSITHTRPVTTVILFDGADLDPIAERRAAFQRATLIQMAGSRQPLRIGDEDPDVEAGQAARDAASSYDEFLDEALTRATHVKLAAVGRKAFRDLVAEHPPRADRKDGDEVVESFPQDHQNGFDVDGIAEPLILGCLRAWDVDARPEGEEPQFDDDAARQAFVDGLSDGEFSRLASSAIPLNRSGGPDPKARLSSVLGQILAETSGSPDDLD